MIRFLADENFNAAIVRAARARRADLDIIDVHEAKISGVDDVMLLQWCADHGRVLLTHDINTIPGYAYQRVRAGMSMPGVFEVTPDASIPRVVEDLLIIAQCSFDEEWEGQVRYLPLK